MRCHIDDSNSQSQSERNTPTTLEIPKFCDMADYGKQTVAQLRQLLKDRGIPSTGLTRKAQIVEKLEEKDAEGEIAQVEDEDAPEPDAQGEEEDAKDVDGKPDVPGTALSEAGGMAVERFKQAQG